MRNLNNLKDEINDVTTLKYISSAFTEASATKIKKIRESFDKNRQFYNEISYVYHLVISSAKKRNLHPNSAETVKEKKSKTLSVAFTSNQRFYGALNTMVIQSLIRNTLHADTDLIVIGITGVELMKSSDNKRQFRTFTFTHDNPSSAEITSFLDGIAAYDNVFLYHPKFVSLLSQNVGITEITEAFQAESELKEEVDILFEPELSEIVTFFKTQVRMLLFLRVMLESDLSRTAARLLSMSAAEERSDVLIREKSVELRIAKSSIINAQLLETFAGMSKWKKE